MAEPDSIHHSVWIQRHPLDQRFPSLTADHHSDVAIIGGGITGLSVALELLHRGFSVAVYEASVIGAGTTGGSTGHLDALPECGAWDVLDRLGQPAASEYVHVRQQAIRAIQHRSAGECDFRRVPAYRYTDDRQEISDLGREFDAALKMGLTGQWQDVVPFPGSRKDASADSPVGFQLHDMACIDIMAYLRRLTELVVQAGGKIFEGTMVEPPSRGDRLELSAGDAKIHFQHVVCATNSNFTGSLSLDMRTPAYQSYVLVARVVDPPPDALFWDNSESYYYTRRLYAQENLLLIGGCDHRTGDGNPLTAHVTLEDFARDRFHVESIETRWSAELFESADGLPLIGRVPGIENAWVATGLSGVGLTWGTAAGWLIADQIAGGESILQEPLSPSRFSRQTLTGMVAEQAAPMRSFARRILPAQTIDVDELQPGQGAVGNLDGEHVAVCRDLEGTLHQCDPICTHMGGVVSWNEAEQTWDCPVHGGRYTACGKRLYGPPREGLQSKHGEIASSR